jgi:hypothetical protein
VAIVKIWGLLLRLLLHGEDSVGSSSTYRLLLIVLLGWLEDAMKSEWKLDAFSSPWIETVAFARFGNPVHHRFFVRRRHGWIVLWMCAHARQEVASH